MMKTIDKKVVYKVADLSQIMVCSHDLADTANAKDAKSAKKVRFCLNSFSRKLKFFFNDWLERERRYPTIMLFASFFSYATRYFAPSNSISNCCCMNIGFALQSTVHFDHFSSWNFDHSPKDLVEENLFVGICIFEEQKQWQYPHGLTPPMKSVRVRRFRKTKKKRFMDAPEVTFCPFFLGALFSQN